MTRRQMMFIGIAIAVIGGIALADLWLSATPMADAQANRLNQQMATVNPLRPPPPVDWAWLVGWRDRLGTRHGLNASYRCLTNRILVPRALEAIAFDPVMEPTYAHELVHAAQRQRMGLVWYLFLKVFQRQHLEAEALAEENRVAWRENQ